MNKYNGLDFETIDNGISIYLKTLIEKKGKGVVMPDNVLGDMILSLYPRFEKFLFVSAIQNLSEDGKKKFDDFTEEDPTPEKSLEFLEENVENFPAVIKNAMDEFENIYLGNK